MSASPFLSSNHGHPSFNPVKIGKNLNAPDTPTKNSKQPKPPDKPLMPYMRYSKKVWDEVRARYLDLKIWEISKIVGQMWRDLPDENKQDYIDAFESEKAEYNESLKVYHNSPAYQSWISTLKSKEHEDRDTQKQKGKKSGPHGLNSPQKADGRVSLQSMDSELEDEDEYFSVKHLSAARFYRNHRLVAEIFNEALVPDARSVISHARYQVLRRQVESLTTHQKRLADELQLIEEVFQEKKRSLLEGGEKFTTELNKRFVTKPVDEATYKQMVEKALEQIRKENSASLANTAATTEAPVNSGNSANDTAAVAPNANRNGPEVAQERASNEQSNDSTDHSVLNQE